MMLDGLEDAFKGGPPAPFPRPEPVPIAARCADLRCVMINPSSRKGAPKDPRRVTRCLAGGGHPEQEGDHQEEMLPQPRTSMTTRPRI